MSVSDSVATPPDPEAEEPAPPEAADPEAGRAGASVASLGGGALGARLVAFVGTAYLARVLGPAAFGIIGFALALTKYFRLAVDGGFNPVGAREVAMRPAKAPSIAASVVLFRLALAAGALALLAIVAFVLPKPVDTRLVVFLMGLEFVGLAVDTSWVYKGLERNRAAGIALVLAEAASVAALFSFVHSPSDVVAVPLALFSGQLVAAGYLAWPLFRSASVRARFREGMELFKKSSFLIVSKVMRVLFFSVDVLLLGFIVGEVAVGLYTAAYRVVFVLTALSGAVAFSYLPEFTRAARDRTPLGGVADRALELSAAVVLPALVGGVLLAEPMMVGIFGADYAGAALAFQFLLVSIVFNFLRSTPSNVLLVRDRLRLDMWIVSGATALNVALNLFWIPRYGLEGAAAATLASEAVNLVGALVAMALLGAPLRARPFVRSALAAVAMGGVLVTVGTEWHVFLRVALGGLAYAVALVALGGIPEDVRPWLRTLASRIRPRQ